MATINLGAIKFKWQGAYNAGTAYTVDDVVSYQGSSYICIAASTGNLPTNATYWEQMSSAGTNGTDLTTTLTTQGDIVYRNASGLARLGAGTAGQVLQTGGAGANVSWTDIAGGTVKQVVFTQSITATNTNSTSFVTTNFGVNITKQSATSKILLLANVNLQISGNSGRWTIYRDNSTNVAGTVSGGQEIQTTESATGHNPAVGLMIDEATLSTGTYNYTIYFRNSGGGTVYFNPTAQSVMSLIAIEYEV